MRIGTRSGTITIRDRRRAHRHAGPRATAPAVRKLMSEVAFKQATIDKLTHEMAVLKRLKFAAKSEAFSAEQKSLLEEAIDADLAALAAEIEAQQPKKPAAEDKQQPKRQPLPAHLPRREIRHDRRTPPAAAAAMKRIGEDVAEKLDYQPGVFTVERHVRGKWVCAAARRWCRRRCRRTSSTRASPPPACWPRCWWPSTWTTCRCTGRKPSSSAPGWPSPARPWRSGWAPAACSCSRWSTR
jgi:hypothetical protein